jgi:hypothetical protein
MRYTLSVILFCLLLCGPQYLSAQPISPLETDAFCPLQPGGNAFQITGSGRYYLSSPGGMTIISDVDRDGRFVVSFSDKKEGHYVNLYLRSGAFARTISFTKINTLAGISPKFPTPPTGTPPIGYQDMVPFPLCYTNSVNYTSPTVRYKDASGNEYGNPMNFYEWVAPAGWQINGNVSNGTTPILAGSPSATITPTALTGGGQAVKVRALNNCNPSGLSPSNYYQIYIDRPVLKLSVNGASSLQLTCGTSSPTTFTVENGSQATCVTSYDWDLGSNDNNWLYNGSPAPRFITTTTPSLTITPNTCIGTPANVAVALKGNGITYATFTLPVTMVSPQLAISGLSFVCNSETYTLGALSCNASVVWSASPDRNVTLTSNGNSVTVTKRADGPVTLTAVITGLCGGPRTIEKQLTLGTPVPIIVGPFDPLTHTMEAMIYSERQYYFVAQEYVANPPASYLWHLIPYPGSPNFSTLYSGSPATMGMPPEISNVTYTLQLTKTNTCGTTLVERSLVIHPNPGFMITTAPNPSSEEIVVTLNKYRNTSNWKREKVTLALYDFMTGQLVKRFLLDNGQKRYRLNVRDVKKGNYVLKVTEGISTQSKQIIIE